MYCGVILGTVHLAVKAAGSNDRAIPYRISFGRSRMFVGLGGVLRLRSVARLVIFGLREMFTVSTMYKKQCEKNNDNKPSHNPARFR